MPTLTFQIRADVRVGAQAQALLTAIREDPNVRHVLVNSHEQVEVTYVDGLRPNTIETLRALDAVAVPAGRTLDQVAQIQAEEDRRIFEILDNILPAEERLHPPKLRAPRPLRKPPSAKTAHLLIIPLTRFERLLKDSDSDGVE